jgi:beta propeller repeat protein
VLILFPSAAFTQNQSANNARYVKGELIVRFHEGSFLRQHAADSSSGLIDILQEAGITSNVKRSLRSRASNARSSSTRISTIKLGNSADTEKAAAVLLSHPDVLNVERNLIIKAMKVPDDHFFHTSGSWGQGYDDLWGVKKIKGPESWDITEGQGVVVAVIDSGVDYTHPDLAANIYRNPGEIEGNGIDDDGNGFIDDFRGWDFTTCAAIENGECTPKARDNDPMDGQGHGTHVAGTIAAVGNNQIGIIGVAPKAKILPIKALGDDGQGALDDLADAVLYAVYNGADVINASWGAAGDSFLLQQVFEECKANGVICVAAAGNDNKDVKNYVPAGLDSVLTIGATDHSDKKSGFSNYHRSDEYGPRKPTKVDVSAPGGDTGDFFLGSPLFQPFVNILSLRAKGTDMFAGSPFYDPASFVVSDGLTQGAGYYRAMGTSMAAPHASGAAALVYSRLLATTTGDPKSDITLRRKLRRETIARLIYTADQLPDTPKDGDGKSVSIGTGRINTLRAIQASPRPQFEILSDILEEHQGNGNRIPDADEVVSLAFHIRNVWDNATGVTGHLINVSNAPVTIERSQASFGDIDGDASGNNNANPFLIRIGGIAGIRHIKLALVLRANGSSSAVEQTLPIQITLGARRVSATVPGANSALEQIFQRPFRAALSGHRVVWTDTRAGNQDVYLYDFATGQELLISHDENAGGVSHPRRQGHPDIDGDVVIWEDGRARNSDLYYYNVRQGGAVQKVSLPENLDPRHQIQPALDGNMVAWTLSALVSEVSKDSQIYVSDIQTGITVAITSGAGSKLNPDLSQGRLVYEDAAQAGVLMVPNILAPTPGFDISPALVFPQQPFISGNRLVYTGVDLFSGINIFAVDIPENPSGVLSAQNLTGNFYIQTNPAIFGPHVVWQGESEEDWEIFYQNTETGVQKRMTAEGLEQNFYPVLSDSYIAWVSDEVLWATQVPGAAPPVSAPLLPIPGGGSSNGDDGGALTVSMQAKFAAKKGKLKLSLSSNESSGCHYEIMGSGDADSTMVVLGALPVEGTSQTMLIKKLPAIKGKKSKNKRRRANATQSGVYLQAHLRCPNGEHGASEKAFLKGTKRPGKKVAPAKWIGKLAKKLQKAS